MRLMVLCLIAVLTACSPKPRAVSYFMAHPDVAARMEQACTRGAVRGTECQNAAAAIAALKRDARMANYKRAFE